MVVELRTVIDTHNTILKTHAVADVAADVDDIEMTSDPSYIDTNSPTYVDTLCPSPEPENDNVDAPSPESTVS